MGKLLFVCWNGHWFADMSIKNWFDPPNISVWSGISLFAFGCVFLLCWVCSNHSITFPPLVICFYFRVLVSLSIVLCVNYPLFIDVVFLYDPSRWICGKSLSKNGQILDITRNSLLKIEKLVIAIFGQIEKQVVENSELFTSCHSIGAFLQLSSFWWYLLSFPYFWQTISQFLTREFCNENIANQCIRLRLLSLLFVQFAFECVWTMVISPYGMVIRWCGLHSSLTINIAGFSAPFLLSCSWHFPVIPFVRIQTINFAYFCAAFIRKSRSIRLPFFSVNEWGYQLCIPYFPPLVSPTLLLPIRLLHYVLWMHNARSISERRSIDFVLLLLWWMQRIDDCYIYAVSVPEWLFLRFIHRRCT